MTPQTMLWWTRVRQRALIITAVLVAVFVLIVLAIAGYSIEDRRRAALVHAREQASRFVDGAEAAMNRNLLGLDVLLASMDNVLNLSNSQRDWIDAKAADRQIQLSMRQNLLANRIALIDAQGRTIASSDNTAEWSRLGFPDEFPAQVLAPRFSALVLSQPTLSSHSGELVLYMGRHLRLGDGSRLIAVAEVPVYQLASILVQGVNIAGLQATLEHGNGNLLVASPMPGEIRGRRLTPPLEELGDLREPQSMAARLDGQPALVVARSTLYGGVHITASIPESALFGATAGVTRLIWFIACALVLMLVSSGGVAVWFLNHLTDTQAAMAQSKRVLDEALGSMDSGFLLLDGEQRVVTWNPRYLEIHPWLAAHLVVGLPFARLALVTAEHLLPEAGEAERLRWVESRLDSVRIAHGRRQVATPQGSVLEVSERRTPDGGTVILYQDVTQLQKAIADVELLAFYDPLTGMPNRRLLNDRLQQALTACQRTGRHGALLFLDLDHFKTLNDTAGHLVGDMLLQQVAQRLQSCVRAEDTVARLGGDEFVVMLQNLSTEAEQAELQTRRVADAILYRLSLPYNLRDEEHTNTCSLGATLFGKDDQTPTDLLKQADIAMYQVKTAGRNALCFFHPRMLSVLTERADLVRDLRHALAQDQFVLYFQVQIGAVGQAIGAEVLLRWLHPARGMVPPLQFIDLAEETGLIVDIGDWVLRSACRQLARWQQQGDLGALQLSVNVSARQFRAPDFVEQVARVLRDSGARATALKLELTETLVLDNIADTIAKMHQLRALGVRFALDDFGTGYSSLAYLTRLPLNQLKIDQSFVRNIGQQQSDSAVIDTIIGLAGSLGLEVIAEGVETEAQRAFLEQHGCLHYQGYLFGRPLPIEEFETQTLAFHPASPPAP